jgi:hypothetical protein
VLGQHRLGHAQHLVLGRVGVGDEAPLHHIRRAGNLGQQCREQTARAAFGSGKLQATLSQVVEESFGLGCQV